MTRRYTNPLASGCLVMAVALAVMAVCILILIGAMR